MAAQPPYNISQEHESFKTILDDSTFPIDKIPNVSDQLLVLAESHDDMSATSLNSSVISVVLPIDRSTETKADNTTLRSQKLRNIKWLDLTNDANTKLPEFMIELLLELNKLTERAFILTVFGDEIGKYMLKKMKTVKGMAWYCEFLHGICPKMESCFFQRVRRQAGQVLPGDWRWLWLRYLQFPVAKINFGNTFLRKVNDIFWFINACALPTDNYKSLTYNIIGIKSLKDILPRYMDIFQHHIVTERRMRFLKEVPRRRTISVKANPTLIGCVKHPATFSETPWTTEEIRFLHEEVMILEREEEAQIQADVRTRYPDLKWISRLNRLASAPHLGGMRKSRLSLSGHTRRVINDKTHRTYMSQDLNQRLHTIVANKKLKLSDSISLTSPKSGPGFSPRPLCADNGIPVDLLRADRCFLQYRTSTLSINDKSCGMNLEMGGNRPKSQEPYISRDTSDGHYQPPKYTDQSEQYTSDLLEKLSSSYNEYQQSVEHHQMSSNEPQDYSFLWEYFSADVQCSGADSSHSDVDQCPSSDDAMSSLCPECASQQAMCDMLKCQTSHSSNAGLNADTEDVAMGGVSTGHLDYKATDYIPDALDMHVEPPANVPDQYKVGYAKETPFDSKCMGNFDTTDVHKKDSTSICSQLSQSTDYIPDALDMQVEPPANVPDQYKVGYAKEHPFDSKCMGNFDTTDVHKKDSISICSQLSQSETILQPSEYTDHEVTPNTTKEEHSEPGVIETPIEPESGTQPKPALSDQAIPELSLLDTLDTNDESFKSACSYQSISIETYSFALDNEPVTNTFNTVTAPETDPHQQGVQSGSVCASGHLNCESLLCELLEPFEKIKLADKADDKHYSDEEQAQSTSLDFSEDTSIHDNSVSESFYSTSVDVQDFYTNIVEQLECATEPDLGNETDNTKGIDTIEPNLSNNLLGSITTEIIKSFKKTVVDEKLRSGVSGERENVFIYNMAESGERFLEN